MARSTWKRWLPAGAVVALIAGTVTITSQAGAVDLPDKSPQDVLTLLLEQDVRAYSGSVETSADLGLPVPADLDLGPGGPDLEVAAPTPEGGEGSADAQEVLSALELLTGDNTGRVFVGEQGARFQHTDGLAERNVVVTSGDVWFYDSEANAATHLVLPEGHEGTHREPAGTLPTPEELAATAVEALEPSTELSVGQHERVAGRDAYTLTLTPRAEETLVAGVTIAVDGETGFPLGVTVTARDQSEPALRAQYTDITFAEPDPDLFDFAAPAGATVEEEVLEMPADAGAHAAPDHAAGATPPGEVLGEGWGAVVVVPDVEVPDDPMLDELTEPVEGGRLLSTALLSVLLTDDGRLLVGAVEPTHLEDLAAGR
ncbi:Outer membrane lipoprotein-sorting protein [Georgenia satyanarayanai]|uniref:Outer membrane lipoprotein-sorting protein n=1 Tax=Georgenia satyanarayanai TaxID=860221 RepID=A0A2Y9APP5_9MICO|nr:DUF2092 domain-containing protein [Georgenia satyanarayanai]PYF97278.1 outer membrane lipoprotein-sorting protein [Georgenia satyanarayanai]SSA46364.1 Outer membrane lipoprotein-sorting protein [Georgenia satyanarayanai]